MLYRFKCILFIFFLTMGASLSGMAKGFVTTPEIHEGEYITVNGLPMYIEQTGKGRALVLLHGGLSTIQKSFEKQIEAFSKNHHVIAIEQIGHGHTPDAGIPFSYTQMAKDTVKVLRSLNVKDADIVGWSDGGILALIIAGKHSELVHRVVVSGANTELVGLPPAEVQAIQESSGEELAQNMPPSEHYNKVSPDGPEHWPAVVKKVWDMWITPVVIKKEDLAKILAPVLVVCGDSDIIPLEHTIEIFKSLPNAKLLVLPGTGHHTFNEAADTINPIILTFLDAP